MIVFAGVKIQTSSIANPDASVIIDTLNGLSNHDVEQLQLRLDLKESMEKSGKFMPWNPGDSRSWIIHRLNTQRDAIIAAGDTPRLRIPESGMLYYEKITFKE